MILVQRFHSIHDIDPEFITNLESLLMEDFPSFDTMLERHDGAPESDVFIYFLFFGPTQNTPIGFSQVCLRKIPHEGLVPWWRKLMFWNKDYLHWKQAIWKVADGNTGYFVFDPKFSRTIKEKVQELVAEVQKRDDVKAQHIYYLKGLQDFQLSWQPIAEKTEESYVLEPLVKAYKSYEDYLGSLPKEVSTQIKNGWMTLHKKNEVKLGDYPTVTDLPKGLELDPSLVEKWKKLGAQVLTFERDQHVLGCLIVLKGKGGNVFIEPLPFEPEDKMTVSDELYTQYAILKFYELANARKCHMLKSGTKLVFKEREDLRFFLDQGFQQKMVTRQFASRLKKFLAPV